MIDPVNVVTSIHSSMTYPSKYVIEGICEYKQYCIQCGREIKGGEYILGNLYCPMCASIIHKNNSGKNISNILKYKGLRDVPDSCKGCGKHPSNGGDGICHCTLGGPRITY